MICTAEPGSNLGSPALAWASRAGELAAWAWARLVNRADVWGGYRPLSERGKTYRATDGATRTLGTPTTHPALRDRGRVFLCTDILRRHFAATVPERVMGLHTTSPENTSLAGAVEVDCHGDDGDPAANWRAALAWYGRLIELGFRPLLTDSNGKGGLHLRALFCEAVPTPRVYAFLKWLTADWRKHGLPTEPETFPKQPRIDPGKYGNWLRLPGRHHTREHWSCVWDGQQWVDGNPAIDHILSLSGDSAKLIPEVMVLPVKLVPVKHHDHLPVTGDVSRRIAGYLRRLPAGLGEGMHRDDHGYKFACFLVRDLGLSDAEALPWLEEWDSRNGVAKGAQQLQKLLTSARAYGKHAYGSGLLTSTIGVRA